MPDEPIGKQLFKSKSKRPDGLSLDEYKGHEKWSYRRWAWEFLRRNDNFAKACIAVDNEERTPEEVAREFHLSRFKHFKSAYKSAQSPAPSFSMRTIKKRANFNANGGVLPRARQTIAVEPGHIWLRFDLTQEFLVGGSLNAQIRVAEHSLHQALSEYAAITGRSPAAMKKPQRKTFLPVLRRLDAVEAHKGNVQGLMALHPALFDNNDSVQRTDQSESLMRTLYKYAEDVYLTLAIRAGK
jgi:hypothetical protein